MCPTGHGQTSPWIMVKHSESKFQVWIRNVSNWLWSNITLNQSSRSQLEFYEYFLCMDDCIFSFNLMSTAFFMFLILHSDYNAWLNEVSKAVSFCGFSTLNWLEMNNIYWCQKPFDSNTSERKWTGMSVIPSVCALKNQVTSNHPSHHRQDVYISSTLAGRWFSVTQFNMNTLIQASGNNLARQLPFWTVKRMDSRWWWSDCRWPYVVWLIWLELLLWPAVNRQEQHGWSKRTNELTQIWIDKGCE